MKTEVTYRGGSGAQGSMEASVECGECGGYGWIDIDPEGDDIDCAACNGTGREVKEGMSVLGSSIEIMLSDRKWNQSKLAEISGLTPAAISQIISGEREPMVSSLLKICHALDTTPNDLLGFHARDKRDMQQEIAFYREIVNQVRKLTDVRKPR